MVDAGAPTTTHLVVNDHVIRSIPFEYSSKTYVVKSEVGHPSSQTALFLQVFYVDV